MSMFREEYHTGQYLGGLGEVELLSSSHVYVVWCR